MRGRITSSNTALVIRSKTYGSSSLNEDGQIRYLDTGLSVAIEDRGSHKIGLVLTGAQEPDSFGVVMLSGSQSNTFTGNVVIEGERNVLYLGKTNGATAIQSNVYVRDGARVAFSRSNQIADSSTVTLTGSGSQLTFVTSSVALTEKIHALKVESGNTIFNFAHWGKAPDNSKKTLVLDDLIIEAGATLKIIGWKEGRDHLLVRKDSKYLADALKKLSIDGWGKNQVYLKDYDKDYWSIEAAPEPGTYGAILAAVGLGLVIWRRRWDSNFPLRSNLYLIIQILTCNTKGSAAETAPHFCAAFDEHHKPALHLPKIRAYLASGPASPLWTYCFGNFAAGYCCRSD